MVEFKFGLCKHCKTWASLKDDICLICNKNELPEFFKDLFNRVNKRKK